MNTIIIGSGPAGYTAAIYAARADLKPIIYTGLEPGGQLTTTTEVDNFPGYPKGVDGPTMMNELKEQAERFGTKVEVDFISRAEFSKELLKNFNPKKLVLVDPWLSFDDIKYNNSFYGNLDNKGQSMQDNYFAEVSNFFHKAISGLI